MKYQVIYRSPGCLRIALPKKRMTEKEADVIYYALVDRQDVTSVQVFMRIANVVIRYDKKEKDILSFLSRLDFNDPETEELIPSVSARNTNEQFKSKIVGEIMKRAAKRLLLPAPVQAVWTVVDGAPFIIDGVRDVIHGHFSAEIVHASAIGASIVTRDFSTAGSITFLTKIGEILEEWTYKKSVDDLAQSLALNVTKVWLVEGETSRQVGIHQVKAGDLIQVSMGNMIPLDGVVTEGEAMVNQAALTGEPIAVLKKEDSTVYAGTVVEEGELFIKVQESSGETRYDKIVRMIEESESMASVTQSRAERVVSKLIPYTFTTAVIVGLLTRNLTKAASVLMVDFSCAIEVAMPIATLSTMREAGRHHVTVKGGKFLELLSQADTIVFDKTGTLTKATPVVETVVAMNGEDPDEMLKLAACMEEHFPHSLANAVVRAAKERNLEHLKFQTKPVYVVAHGVHSTVNGTRVVIGSYHYLFEDEHAVISEEDRERMNAIPSEYSRLYMAIDGKISCVIGIDDPLRKDSADVIAKLKECGIKNIVMMTGDSDKTAAAIAASAGITEYYSEVLPEDKANYVKAERDKGRKVIMIGDGINDSPALSAADVGIAMKEGADIAREIADITLSGSDLEQLVMLRFLSNKLMTRMNGTAYVGIGFNALILVLGILGVVVPGTAAFLHNASTIGLALHNMTDILPEAEQEV